MDFEGKPQKVRREMVKSNSEALSRMGASGARAAHEKRKEKRLTRAIFDELKSEKNEQEMDERQRAANEHIVPIDGDEKLTDE